MIVLGTVEIAGSIAAMVAAVVGFAAFVVAVAESRRRHLQSYQTSLPKSVPASRRDNETIRISRGAKVGFSSGSALGSRVPTNVSCLRRKNYRMPTFAQAIRVRSASPTERWLKSMRDFGTGAA